MEGRICGVSLAGLLYEHSRSPADQEGFLLGRIETTRTDVITDSQESSSVESVLTIVDSYIVCGPALSWYDKSFNIDERKLQEITKSFDFQRVVGWYKFRRNSKLIPSLREQYLHDKMLKRFPFGSRFLFLLCGATRSKNGALHNYSQIFFKQHDGELLPADIAIRNLGETGHDNYRVPPDPTQRSTAFNQVSQTMSKTFMNERGVTREVESIRDLARSMQEKLTTACEKVAKSEEELGQWRQKVADLKKQIKKQKAAKPQPAAAQVPKVKQSPVASAKLAQQHRTPGANFKFMKPLSILIPKARTPAQLNTSIAQPSTSQHVPQRVSSGNRNNVITARSSSGGSISGPRRMVSNEETTEHIELGKPHDSQSVPALDLISFEDPVDTEMQNDDKTEENDDVILVGFEDNANLNKRKMNEPVVRDSNGGGEEVNMVPKMDVDPAEENFDTTPRRRPRRALATKKKILDQDSSPQF